VVDKYRVRAHNMATASANKIHDDAVAQQYGFKGGLVPGVEVYAYMTHPVVERLGRNWLSRGAMHVRLRRPVYDGREVCVTTRLADHDHGALELALHDETSELCALATALPVAARTAMDMGAFRVAPLPNRRPPASAEALAAADPLGTVTKRFDAVSAKTYLDGISETLPIFAEGIAHPGWLLRRANRILAANVELGPWIHVESEVTNLGLVRDDDVVSTRGRVTQVWERGGHKFVALDVLVAVDERPVMYVNHTAIYEPRHD
jgi:hypothetical protein